MRKVLPLCVILMVSFTSWLSGEEPSCDDEMVARLAHAGVASDLILDKINGCTPNFNLDPAHLIALKQAGVSDDLVRAMARRQTSGQMIAAHTSTYGVRPAAIEGKNVVPDEVGVYWAVSPRELSRVEGIAVSNMRTGSTLASRMTLHIKRARINAQLKGGRSDMRINLRQPQFIIYLPEGASIGDYLLIRMAQRQDVRQIEVAEETFWKAQSGIDHFAQVDVSFERIGVRLYSVVPKGELARGEYGFYVAAGPELSKPTGRIYDFGID